MTKNSLRALLLYHSERTRTPEGRRNHPRTVSARSRWGFSSRHRTHISIPWFLAGIALIALDDGVKVTASRRYYYAPRAYVEFSVKQWSNYLHFLVFSVIIICCGNYSHCVKVLNYLPRSPMAPVYVMSKITSIQAMARLGIIRFLYLN